MKSNFSVIESFPNIIYSEPELISFKLKTRSIKTSDWTYFVMSLKMNDFFARNSTLCNVLLKFTVLIYNMMVLIFILSICFKSIIVRWISVNFLYKLYVPLFDTYFLHNVWLLGFSIKELQPIFTRILNVLTFQTAYYLQVTIWTWRISFKKGRTADGYQGLLQSGTQYWWDLIWGKIDFIYVNYIIRKNYILEFISRKFWVTISVS